MKIVILTTNNIALIFDTETQIETRTDIDALIQEEFQVLLYDSAFYDLCVDTFLQKISLHIPCYPINSIASFDINNKQSMMKEIEKQMMAWSLKNSLYYIEHFYDLFSNLQKNWKQTPSLFIEEFAYVLKKIIPSSELKIIFNDTIQEENQKPQLVRKTYQGHTRNIIRDIKPQEEKLIELYKNPCESSFEIIEQNMEKKSLFIKIEIKQSPIFILARSFHYNQVTNAFLKGLVKALNTN